MTREEAIRERDELRRANVTPEDAERPLGQSVEYWQDRCLDHATALGRVRVERDGYRAALERIRRACQIETWGDDFEAVVFAAVRDSIGLDV